MINDTSKFAFDIYLIIIRYQLEALSESLIQKGKPGFSNYRIKFSSSSVKSKKNSTARI